MCFCSNSVGRNFSLSGTFCWTEEKLNSVNSLAEKVVFSAVWWIVVMAFCSNKMIYCSGIKERNRRSEFGLDIARNGPSLDDMSAVEAELRKVFASWDTELAY